ncbi:MAG TPA: CYTH domain-containing protein, partial [Spirochaetia bacterium]|nr:CYTH domain-containing protein [Spirochaetia bacterium]
MSLETEAKFVISDLLSFNQVKSLRSLAGFSLAPVKELSVRDDYLDTPGRSLLAAGWALRFRRKEGLILVTAKSTTGASGGLHEREELEIQLPSAVPAQDWPESALRSLVLSAQGRDPLGVLFEVHQERLIREVTRGGRRVAEMSLDMVKVLAGGKEKEYLELEVELGPDGSREELLSLASVLQKDLTLDPSPRSKFEEGLLLLDGKASTSRPVLSRRRKTPPPTGPRKTLVLAAPEGATAEAV